MKVIINNRSLISVKGSDAQSFLQSQLTNDINNLEEKKVQINAYCQHQGKILAILWVIKLSDTYMLIVPKELSMLIIEKLNLYKFMSDVSFQDLTKEFFLYGLIDEEIPDSFRLARNMDILLSKEEVNSMDYELWERDCIERMIPEVLQITSEKFIPQALNLDIAEFGVSFTKGCYPGQEVVARMHYLGEPKRRLFRFTSRFEVLVGDSLDVTDSKSLKSSGQVIRAVMVDGEFHFLGVFEVNYINDKIFLNKDQNKLVSIIHE